ncbi:hypothetical protein ABDB91_04120 [Desulfoscipio sp. XC116]|uniref:hypothetical protein n=1 Tax=Desulfoscipio sp. XC116 TaxID=3144975 RepID=UPI00325A7CA5
MNIKYRDAQKKDCSKVAEYINYASDGVLDFLFEGTVGGMTVTQILTHGLLPKTKPGRGGALA